MNQVASATNPTFKNAAKILPSDADTGYDKKKRAMRYIQVLNNTANFCNGLMLLRRYVPAPNGLYNVSMDGSIYPAAVPAELFFDFPNFEVVRPPFEKMKPLCVIPKTVMGGMIQILQEITRRDGTAVIDRDSIWMKQDVGVILRFPFNMAPKININAKFLETTLIEMLQYEEIVFLREERLSEGEDLSTPLVVGRDWGSCAVIMPLKRERY